MQPEQATIVALNRQLASLPVMWGVVGGRRGGPNDFAPITLAALWLIPRVTSAAAQGAVCHTAQSLCDTMCGCLRLSRLVMEWLNC